MASCAGRFLGGFPGNHPHLLSLITESIWDRTTEEESPQWGQAWFCTHVSNQHERRLSCDPKLSDAQLLQPALNHWCYALAFGMHGRLSAGFSVLHLEKLSSALTVNASVVSLSSPIPWYAALMGPPVTTSLENTCIKRCSLIQLLNALKDLLGKTGFETYPFAIWLFCLWSSISSTYFRETGERCIYNSFISCILRDSEGRHPKCTAVLLIACFYIGS